MEAPVKKTWKPTVAGILMIIVGAFSIVGAFFAIVISALISAGSSWAGLNGNDFGTVGSSTVAAVVLVLGIIAIIFAILEIISGIFSLNRKIWGLALAGAIVTALTSTVLGVLAIIFLAMGKDEFS
jgi:magnesium-transporting ATPase (P-type)